MKKIILFISAFIIACAILFIFNVQNKYGENEDKYFLDEYKINVSQPIVIKLTNAEDLNHTNEVKYRIHFIMTDDLTDTIKVYRDSFYDRGKDSFVFNVNDNLITIGDYMGPVSFYTSQSFLTNAQFDYTYFDTEPKSVYEIHVPTGVAHRISK